MQVDGISGAILKTVNLPQSSQPIAIAFAFGSDASSEMCVAEIGANSIARVFPDTGAIALAPVGVAPQAVALDGTNIWVSNGADNTVSELNVNGSLIRSP